MKSVSVEESREYYPGSDSAHDFDHVLRVLALAERIGEAERADMEVLRTAVLLHDIARPDEEKGLDHAQASAEEARRILESKGWSQDRIEKVHEAIRSHRFRGGPTPQSLEARILYDADKLDSIGAIGVARAYAVAGRLGQRLWIEVSEKYTLGESNLSTEHSPVAEYLVKLRHLKDALFTSSARELAAARHQFMVQFFERLEKEVRGEY